MSVNTPLYSTFGNRIDMSVKTPFHRQPYRDLMRTLWKP